MLHHPRTESDSKYSPNHPGDEPYPVISAPKTRPDGKHIEREKRRKHETQPGTRHSLIVDNVDRKCHCACGNTATAPAQRKLYAEKLRRPLRYLMTPETASPHQ